MNKEAKQAKKEAIEEAKREFSKPKRLADIPYNDPLFLEDLILWGLRPIRLSLDALEDLSRDPNIDIGLLINDLQIKVDDLIAHMERWIEEGEQADQQEQAA